MGSSKRGAGRPAKPILNRRLIAQRALELVTEGGFDRLTMTQLATKLGVATSALYNHVDSKADIVLLIQDALVSQVSVQGMVQLNQGLTSLEVALEEWARSYRTVFAEYPSLIPLIAVTPVSAAPQTSRMYNIVAEALVTAGVPAEQVINVIVAFESFLFGSAMDVNAPTTILDAGDTAEENVWLARAVAASRSVHVKNRDIDGDFVNPTSVNNFYAEPPFSFGLSALIYQTRALVEPSAGTQ